MKELQAWIERYFPCSFERGGSVLVILGVLSTLLYIYTKIWYEGRLGNLPHNIMLLTFLISAWGQRHRLKSDLVFKLLILAGVIPWLLFGINALIDYETASRYLSAKDLIKLFLFLPVAWWMGGTRAGARRVLAIAFLGLITAILVDPNLMLNLTRLLAGKRVDFAIHNAQHGALFFGLVLIFCVCSFSLRKHSEPDSKWVYALLFLASLIGLLGLVGTQTRAAYLGLFACGLIALLQGVQHRHHFGQDRKSAAKGLLVLAVVAGLLAWSAKEILYDRFANENSTIRVLHAGNLDDLPFDSIGIRIHSWAESLHWIAERPITGWGRMARIDVIQLSDRFPDKIKGHIGHLHNGYLEILVGFGAVGFIFICIHWSVVLRRIKLAASKDLYAFAFYGTVFILVLNMFESFFVKSSGVFAITLFLSAGYSQYLASSLNGKPPD